jgi:hypothetical protein
MIKVSALDHPTRKPRDSFFKFKRWRLGSMLYAIIKTREGRFRENPFSGAYLVVTPETNSLENLFCIFAESGYQTRRKLRAINTS